MSRAVLWRMLASIVAFGLIVVGHASLGSGLFALWVSGLLLAANALHVLVVRHVAEHDCLTSLIGTNPSDEPCSLSVNGGLASADRLSLPAELERELDELQAQLTTLDDQFATELGNH